MAKKNSGALPDITGPLNVPAMPGDKLVPANDMADVAGSLSKGTECPDPLGLVSPFKGGKK